jgi:hypothetical protein
MGRHRFPATSPGVSTQLQPPSGEGLELGHPRAIFAEIRPVHHSSLIDEQPARLTSAIPLGRSSIADGDQAADRIIEIRPW